MYNYTQEISEIKREIRDYSKKMSRGLSKPIRKFIFDMNYGIQKSGSGLLSEISRCLDESIELVNTIGRLANNLIKMTKAEGNRVWENYRNEVKKVMSEEPVFLCDDSDIAKPYGRAFEDLDRVRDGSDPGGRIVSGYHVCECVMLSKKRKQPLSIYSKIYSTKSKGFKSMNHYTLKSIEAAREMAAGKKMTFVMDRWYDSNLFIEELDQEDINFVIRINDNRVLLFKNQAKKAGIVAQQRKGKIKMTLLFDDNRKYDVYVSHTRIVLPCNGKEYTYVMVYGLSEDKPLLLLTNKKLDSKEDVIETVRLYFMRWRVEEYFRVKKQEYGLENMRVRNLKAMNNFNLMSTLVLGHIGILAESMDKKLLFHKIIERSKSIRKKVCFWHYQLSKGIKAILAHAKVGISKLQDVEVRGRVRQMKLNL